jgi:hypothetical protein
MPHRDSEAKKAYMRERYLRKAEEIKEYQREYRERHPDRARKSSRRAYLHRRRGPRSELKQRAVDHLGGHCQRCGFSDSRALVFHHRDPKSKRFNIGNAFDRDDLSWEELCLELDKCDLLCANHHLIIHSEAVDAEANEPLSYPRKLVCEPEHIRHLYWDEGLTLRQIGCLLDVDHSVVQTFMRKHNISRRSAAESKRLKLSKHYFGEDPVE